MVSSPGKVLFPLYSLSKKYDAAPLLSPDINVLLFIIETGCTGNQFTLPITFPFALVNFNKIISLSTSYLYWDLSSLGFCSYENGDLFTFVSSNSPIDKNIEPGCIELCALTIELY